LHLTGSLLFSFAYRVQTCGRTRIAITCAKKCGAHAGQTLENIDVQRCPRDGRGKTKHQRFKVEVNLRIHGVLGVGLLPPIDRESTRTRESEYTCSWTGNGLCLRPMSLSCHASLKVLRYRHQAVISRLFAANRR
jgi:hypothetical protein